MRKLFEQHAMAGVVQHQDAAVLMNREVSQEVGEPNPRAAGPEDQEGAGIGSQRVEQRR